MEGAKELRLGNPTGTPSSDPASLRRPWALVTKALGSAAADMSLVVSAIRDPSPPLESPERPELLGSPKLVGVPKPVGSAEASGIPNPVGSPEASGRTELGSSGPIGGNWMSVGAGCVGAAWAAPIPNPNAASAKLADATAPPNSRAVIEVASIVIPRVEFSLATHITSITVVQNCLIRNTT